MHIFGSNRSEDGETHDLWRFVCSYLFGGLLQFLLKKFEKINAVEVQGAIPKDAIFFERILISVPDKTIAEKEDLD